MADAIISIMVIGEEIMFSTTEIESLMVVVIDVNSVTGTDMANFIPNILNNAAATAIISKATIEIVTMPRM